MSIIIVIIAILTSIILSLFLAKIITRQISEPIDNMKTVAEEMANGNLDVYINIISNDEIGSLASSFSKMIKSLKYYINEISTVLGNISDGNLNISTSENYKGNFIEIKNSLDNIFKSLYDVKLKILDELKEIETVKNSIV